MGAITANTVEHFILDAGVVYLNYGKVNESILGVTRGGASFTIEREIREIEVDGTKGKTEGLHRLVAENVSMTVFLIEVTAESIMAALAGTSETAEAGPPAYDVITSDATIVDANYIDNISIVAPIMGSTAPAIFTIKKAVFTIKNALGDGGLNVDLNDKDKAVVELTFSAHRDATDTNAHWEIKLPTIA